jgi:hypothetical protein
VALLTAPALRHQLMLAESAERAQLLVEFPPAIPSNDLLLSAARLALRHPHPIYAFALLADGRLCVGARGDVVAWEPHPTGGGFTLGGMWRGGHTRDISCFAELPGGRLASGGTDDAVFIWDTAAGAPLTKLSGHRGTVYALAPLPGGRVNITMHVADSHNAISRREERIHVNISLLCICSDIALRNEENHAHLTHCNDSDRPITIGEKKYTCSHTRCISVYMRIEGLKLTRQWQSGGEGASKTDRPRNQTQHSAHFCCAVCSIHENIQSMRTHHGIKSMRINLC